MTHTHDHEHSVAPASRKAVRLTLAALIPAIIATIAGLILLWPNGSPPVAEDPTEYVAGTVVSLREQTCPADQNPAGLRRCGDVAVRVDEGADRGRQYLTNIPSGPGAPTVTAGDAVVLVREHDSQSGASAYQIVDHERGKGLWALLLAFALAVVAFGRWRGVRALAGLAITFAVLLMFVVPAILAGSSPLLAAIIGSSAIMLIVLYLTHGFNLPTSMAVLGTLASLALTGLLAAASTSLLHLTGIASEDASFLSVQFPNVNMLGLLLAGILIGSLGVLDDIAVTQAYTVTELAAANPAMGVGQLYQAASRVGRAHITSVINTIVLAYAGASLPVLLLVTSSGSALGRTLTSEWLTQEIVRSIVGTIGLIAAVPITTALTAWTARLGASEATAAIRSHRQTSPARVG